MKTLISRKQNSKESSKPNKMKTKIVSKTNKVKTIGSKWTMYHGAQPELLKVAFEILVVNRKVVNPPIK